jgi:hypothetical protein
MLVANRARVLNATIQVRSGLTEAIGTLLHHRNPVDPLEVYDWLAQDHTALHKAVSEVCLRGPGILGMIASDIQLQCAKLLELATSLPGQRTVLRNLKGIKRDEAFVTEWLSEVEHLGQLRKSFLKAAQQELGEASASLLRQQPSDSSP